MKKSESLRTVVERGIVALYAAPDGAERGLPWMRVSTGERPSLFVTAAVHGNEVTGIRALQKFGAHLRTKPFCGTVTIAPVLNAGGVERNQRALSEVPEDLNRHFPGAADGTFVERIAHAIFQTIVLAAPDAHVDLHADSTASVPYVILDRYLSPAASKLRPRVEQLASAFDVPRLYDWPTEQYRRSRLDSSLSGSVLNQAHIPSFTVELGACRFADERMAEVALHGLLGVMARLEMIPGVPAPRDAPPVSLRRTTPIRAERAGLVRPMVAPGAQVEKGAALCEISDLFGEEAEVLRAPCAGLVISFPDRYWASPGMGLLTMAVPDE